MYFPLPNPITLLLASASPRRRELLQNLCIPVAYPELKEVNESYPLTMYPAEVPLFLSRKKAEAYYGAVPPSSVLITADTVVIANNDVLGKPATESDARRMLHILSGKTHQVVTGVTLLHNNRLHSFSETTEVDFAPLTDREIDFYIDRFHPFDKAGAYGIQEWIGYIGISGIRGDYYNVMGLPLHALYRNLLAISASSITK